MTYDRYADLGDFAALRLSEQPEPKVAPGEIGIRVRSAAVNPVDWKMMAGGLDPLMTVVFPVIPGWDVAGVVESVGPDTPDFAVGEAVFAYGRKDFVHGGSFAELMSVPARAVARKPASLSFDEAAGLPLAGLTAARTLDRLAVTADETVLIHGAAGGVGGFGVQLARARGARVIGTASEPNHDFLRSLGAEPVRYGAGLAEQVRRLAPEGVDAVADFVGGVVDVTLAVLAAGGRHASIADGTVLEHGGSLVWVRAEGAQLARLAALADTGHLRVPVAATYPLEETRAAFEQSRAGHTRGKLILHVSD